MEIKKLDYDLTVCKLSSLNGIKTDDSLFFIGKTDEEISLVCLTGNAPADTLEHEDGWRAFRIQGILDFSLIGILSKLTAVLAERGIGVFAVSTYNTDYILVKRERFDEALEALKKAGYTVIA